MKLLSMLLFFVRELIFDHKDEYNFNSTKFNTRKFMTVSLMVLSFITNFILVERVYTIALKNLELRGQITELKTQVEVLSKNNRTSPSDSSQRSK